MKQLSSLHPFERRVAQSMVAHNWAQGDEKLAVACSAGADSTALLCALTNIRRFEGFPSNLEVITIDHKLRSDSSLDVQFVQQLCQVLGVECISCAVPNIYQKSGQSLEDWAREQRYQLFTDHASRQRWDYLCLGHHADDQAETVFWRLLTGSDWSTFKGIRNTRVLSQNNQQTLVIRPCLKLTKTQILSYLQDIQVQPREDSSNSDLSLFRNKIRRHWLPLLNNENPQFSASLVTLADDIQELDDYVNSQSADLVKNVLEQARHTAVARHYDFTSVLTIPRILQRRVVRAVLRDCKLPIKQKHIEAIIGRLKTRTNGSVRVAAKLEIWLEGTELIVGQKQPLTLQGSSPDSKIPEPSPQQSLENLEPQQLSVNETSIFGAFRFTLWSGHGKLTAQQVQRRLSARTTDSTEVRKRFFANLDCTSLSKLRVRTPRAGEKFRPLGMKQGSKTVQKLFRSRNKDDSFTNYPVITNENDEIVWYVGIEIAEQFKIRSSTQSTLTIVAERLETIAEMDSNHE